MNENFADTPMSLSEIRSSKLDDNTKWEARDALIDLLRQIDKGELNIDRMVICYKSDNKVRYSAYNGSMTELIGLIQYVSGMMVLKGLE